MRDVLYLHLPHPYKCGNRTDSKRWRGAAVILAADGTKPIFDRASELNIVGLQSEC